MCTSAAQRLLWDRVVTPNVNIKLCKLCNRIASYKIRNCFNSQIQCVDLDYALSKCNFSMGVIKSFKAKTVTNLVTPKAAKN